MPADSYETLMSLEEIPFPETVPEDGEEIDIESLVAMEADADSRYAARYAQVQALTVDFILNSL